MKKFRLRHFNNRVQRHAAAGLLAVALLALNASGVAAADQPGTCAAATTSSPLNAWIAGALPTGSDVDVFRFTTTSTGYVQLTLGSLAKNYKLGLYNASCVLLNSSDRIGLQYEEMIRSLPAGRYYLRVSPHSTATDFSPTNYALRFRTIGTGVRVLSSNVYTDSIGYLHIPGDLFNNSGANRIYTEVIATYYNSSNQVIKTDYTFTTQSIVKPYTRAAFDLTTQKPVGYHHYSLAVSSSSTTSQPVGNMALTPGVPYTDSVGYRHYIGQVKNNNSFTVKFVEVILTLYNNRGGVIDTGYTFTNPSTMSAGQAAPFDATSNHFSGTNRYTFLVDATH